MTVVVTHTTPADSTFSSTGAAAWNADHALSGVGTMAEQNANNVAITGGSITGITDLAVADGGTGASTLTGYVKGSGTTPLTASATIPSGDITGLGTMSTQNANAVAITGGTIDNTTIGATTPATGTFTTLTAQTEVLKGTGQNYLAYSQDFTNAGWAKSGITATSTSATTDPLAGLTANLLTADGTTGQKLLGQFNGNTVPKTWSIYVKAGTNNFVQLFFAGDANPYANFNVNTGVVGNIGTTVTATITSIGNGWYRCSIATTSSTAGTPYLGIITSNTSARFESNSLSTTVYAWGAQLEVSSTVGTYTATTTTGVYGTPTLSFSGVSTIGLQSDGSLYHQPAGTGAVQAQATTSSATGGNARGSNAVDWQTLRSVNSMVASATASVIVGGQNNTASAYTSFVGAGANSYAQGSNSFVGAGNGNVVSSGGAYGAIVAGNSNTVSSANSLIGGGVSNTAGGYYNFIGGGFTNVGTSASAVTTQSGTMNATTAVTLSGSNANIKVGQYIVGTSIGNDTYVAAISGTSLTLSKVASGSSTSTLSFFTPHGVVVGGGNNQATGSYSAILGGGDAGTAGNRNSVAGDWSSVVGGAVNTIGSGQTYSVIGGGRNNAISSTGAYSSILGGFNHSVSASYGAVIGGYQQTSNSNYGTVLNGSGGTTRAITGNLVFTASDFPLGVVGSGFTQSASLILARQTTDATATVLTSTSGGAGTTNQVILPNNSAYYFKGSVIANVTGGGNTKAWAIEGAIKRGANAASTALVGTATVTSAYADVGAATWAIAVTADTTNGGLAVTFTGQAATTIRCVAKLETTEVTF